jgi:hypothetical protein
MQLAGGTVVQERVDAGPTVDAVVVCLLNPTTGHAVLVSDGQRSPEVPPHGWVGVAEHVVLSSFCLGFKDELGLVLGVDLLYAEFPVDPKATVVIDSDPDGGEWCSVAVVNATVARPLWRENDVVRVYDVTVALPLLEEHATLRIPVTVSHCCAAVRIGNGVEYSFVTLVNERVVGVLGLDEGNRTVVVIDSGSFSVVCRDDESVLEVGMSNPSRVGRAP